jgi:hypothetical protein
VINPEKGFSRRQTLSGFSPFHALWIPGFSLHSNPGLKLANAFGVISNCITTGNGGAEIANAFGVIQICPTLSISRFAAATK